jgi:hypothetical protein
MWYSISMVGGVCLFVLRLVLIAAFCGFVWRYIEPKTQRMRICRAALLVVGLVVILVALRIFDM